MGIIGILAYPKIFRIKATIQAISDIMNNICSLHFSFLAKQQDILNIRSNKANAFKKNLIHKISKELHQRETKRFEEKKI